MADVIPLPVRRTASAARSVATSAVTAAESVGRLASWDIDDWGRDDRFARFAARVGRLRWDVTIGGDERLPKRGAALVVVNSRRFALTPWVVALALAERTGRPVRFVGRPDTAPFGSLARRLGGLLARPDEVAGALHHDQVLVIGATGVIDGRKVGTIDHRLVGPAVEANVPVFPVAVTAPLSSRVGRIEVGRPVRPSTRRRGPLSEFELTAQLKARLETMLSEFGDSRTGTPLDWLPFTSIGGGS
jgi:hypothetical protein